MMISLIRAAGIVGRINPPGGVPNDPSDITNMIKTIISTAYAIAGVATVFIIIYAGYTILISAGDSDKIRKGQQTLANGVIGLVIVVASALIFNFVAKVLGVENLITVLNLPFL